eukprot:4583918-Prymnesium_polylepis.1
MKESAVRQRVPLSSDERRRIEELKRRVARRPLADAANVLHARPGAGILRKRVAQAHGLAPGPRP